MNKYLELPFIDVSTELAAWENDKADHTYCAVILSQLMNLEKYHNQLGISMKDGFLQLTTDRILETMRYSLKNGKLTRALQTLEDDGLIERTGKHNGLQIIKLRQDAIEELKKHYVNENKRKYFVVYYVCFAYEQAKHPASNVSYMLSAFMQMAQRGAFPNNMSDSFLSMFMGSVFTIAQLKNMLNILKRDGMLTIDSHTIKVNESFASRRAIYLHGAALTELITKYHRDEVEVVEMQSIDLNSAIPSRAIKKTDEKKVGKSFDGVKSETPDDDDMDAIRARWAELAAQGKRVEY